MEVPDIAHDNSTKYDSAGNVIKKGMARYFIEHVYLHSRNQLRTTTGVTPDDDYR